MRMSLWMLFVVAVMAMEQTGTASEVQTAEVMSDVEWRDLATKRNCLLCHEMKRDALGPSLKDIAAEYSNEADAEEMLLKKVYAGGVGKWGNTMMPSQAPPANEEEIKALIRYMLLLK